MATVIEEHKLIFTEVGANSNKYWHGKLTDDNVVHTEWGRVGYDGQSQSKPFGDSLAAKKYLDKKRAEKEKKGYSVQRTVGASPVKVSARKLIQADADPTTQELLDYLVKVNVHNITSNTNISYDAAAGSFSTPLGVVDDDGIREAEALLLTMGKLVEDNRYDRMFESTMSKYMRIIPTPVGMKMPTPESFFPNLDAIKKQQDILDALRASLETIEQQAGDAPIAHRAKLTLLTHDGGKGTETFKRILGLYLKSMNAQHVSAKLRLRRVYEVEINGMAKAFEQHGAKLGNIMELWHGTAAANLLSIMNGGYVVPRSGGSIRVTGRMFGDGVYFSDQSTKSLNYATGFWGGGSYERKFMLLNDVAMGRAFIPSGPFSGGCKPGYDSTFAQAQRSGVRNNEMIVYKTSQIRPRYLCEFS